MSERFDLQRFVDAQNTIYPQVVSELRTGRKQTHWMWFIFPRIVGLGHSPMALQYAIASRAEAQAYVIHPLLGERLSECARLINVIENKNIRHILGSPDDMKFRSSMTFFARVAKLPECSEAIKKILSGRPRSCDLNF